MFSLCSKLSSAGCKAKVSEDTQKKKFFSCGTTKRVGRVNPADHYANPAVLAQKLGRRKNLSKSV